MRKILFAFTVALAMMFTTFTTTQSQAQEYRADYKYGFFSNWSVGFAAGATKTFDFNDWTLGNSLETGVQLRATKRIADRWNLRYIADVPGLYRFVYSDDVNTFDDYAKIVSGVSLNFLKNVYLFADAGLAFDPDGGATLKDKLQIIAEGRGVNIVGQAGLGFNVDFGKNHYNRLFLEAGADCRNHYNPSAASQFEWKPNLFAYLGYTRNLGITQRDRDNLEDIIQYEDEMLRLAEENEMLNVDLEKCIGENSELNRKAEAADNEKQQLKNDLDECLSRKCDGSETSENVSDASGFESVQIYFGYGSSELTEEESKKIDAAAVKIKAAGGEYAVDGYSSVPGSDSFNKKLSEARAKVVCDRLVKAGVDKSTITCTGHGKTGQFGEGNDPNQTVTVTRK